MDSIHASTTSTQELPSYHSQSALSISLLSVSKPAQQGSLGPQTGSAPDGWTTCVHPQGWIYFVNKNLKIITDQDIRNPTLYASFARHMEHKYTLEDQMEFHVFAQGLDDDMAAQQSLTSNSFRLLVDHARCLVFYDEEIHALLEEQTISLDHLQLNRRARLYWNYLWNHPVHIPAPQTAVSAALDALTWFYTDNLISGHKSSVPFSKLECEDLLRIVHQLSEPHEHTPARTVFLSWILRETYKYKDAENHGRYTIKDFQEYLDSQIPQPNPPASMNLFGTTIEFLVVRCLFFGIPSTYHLHVKLTSEYRGRLSSVQSNWENYVDRLVREYSHFLLIATVLLSATIGFLSVGDLPESSIITAIASALTSLASIIVGVFSIWTHQAKTQKSSFYTYLYNAKHSYFGFIGHAVMLSLPSVLLIWAILGFTASLVLYVMKGIGNSDLINRLSSWTLLGIFVILFFLVTFALYTFSIVWKFRQRSRGIFRHLRDSWTRAFPR